MRAWRERESELGEALFPDLTERSAAAADPAEMWSAGQTLRLRAGDFDSRLASHPDPKHRTALDEGFAAAAALAARCGIRAPDPEEFWAAGAPPRFPAPSPTSRDLDLGTRALPVPAPHGLGADAWQRAFADGSLADDLALSMSSEVVRWFAALDAPASPHTPRLTRATPLGPVHWTLRWLPAAPAAPLLGPAHSTAMSPSYPTLPEMLLLQIARARCRGHAPLDEHSFTWLAGELPDTRFAARHGSDIANYTVRIGTRERTDQGPHIGTRLAH